MRPCAGSLHPVAGEMTDYHSGPLPGCLRARLVEANWVGPSGLATAGGDDGSDEGPIGAGDRVGGDSPRGGGLACVALAARAGKGD